MLGPKITVETVDGNHIVQDIGGGAYAFYAHLQKGSLLVKPGDKVTKGQVIAKLGNTGNANASHMHFHLMNGPSVLGSDGLPYVIDRFAYDGQSRRSTLRRRRLPQRALPARAGSRRRSRAPTSYPPRWRSSTSPADSRTGMMFQTGLLRAP